MEALLTGTEQSWVAGPSRQAFGGREPRPGRLWDPSPQGPHDLIAGLTQNLKLRSAWNI